MSTDTEIDGREGAVDVSIVLAAFNAEAFIERAFRSALDQTGVAVELIVVDDASTDGTVAKVRSLAGADERVRVVALPANGGPSVARNAAVEVARGEWIAVLDADDAMLPGRLQRLVEVGRSQGADIVADLFLPFYAATGETGEPPLRLGSAEVLDLSRYIEGARPFNAEADFGLLKPLFRREFLVRNGLRYPIDVRHGEDFELVFRSLQAGARFVLHREPFYLYTMRSSGFSRTRIDYSGLIERSMWLRDSLDPETEATARDLMLERCRALERLEFQHRYKQIRNSDGRAKSLAFALTHKEGWRAIVRKLTGGLAENSAA